MVIIFCIFEQIIELQDGDRMQLARRCDGAARTWAEMRAPQRVRGASMRTVTALGLMLEGLYQTLIAAAVQ